MGFTDQTVYKTNPLPFALDRSPKRCGYCRGRITCPDDIHALEAWQKYANEVGHSLKLEAFHILPLCLNCLNAIQAGRLSLDAVLTTIIEPPHRRPIVLPADDDVIGLLNASQLVTLAVALVGIALNFSVFDH
jgi:hypothetical protein